MRAMKPATFFTLGALAFGGAQAAWSVAHAHGLVRGTWIMKTGTGILACMALFVVVAAVACAMRGKATKLSDGIVALEAGAVLAVLVALFITGPGGLWPIVVVLDAALLGAAIGIGAGLSYLLRPARGGPSPS